MKAYEEESDEEFVEKEVEEEEEVQETQDEGELVIMKRSNRKTGPAPKDKYSGNWTITIAGPKAKDKKALKAPVAENNSTKSEEKVWELDGEWPVVKTKERYEQLGKPIDDPEFAKAQLTIGFHLKQDKDTTMTIEYDAPDWTNQLQISDLLKKMGQECRRKAGCRAEARFVTLGDKSCAVLFHFFN